MEDAGGTGGMASPGGENDEERLSGGRDGMRPCVGEKTAWREASFLA